MVSSIGDILDTAVNIDIVAKGGAWYSYNGTKIGQGRENAKKFLQENQAILNEIDTAVRDYYAFKRFDNLQNLEITEHFDDLDEFDDSDDLDDLNNASSI